MYGFNGFRACTCIQPPPCMLYGCHTNAEISLCCIHVQLYKHVSYFVCVCVSAFDLCPSVSICVYAVILQEPRWQNPKWDHGKGRTENPKSVWSLCWAQSTHLLHFTPHQAFTPPHLIPVCLIYLPSCPSLSHSFALSLFYFLYNVWVYKRMEGGSERGWMTCWVSVLAWYRALKEIWLDGETFTLFVPPLSTLSGCQAQLRGLEGSVLPLQSHPLWQYLATPFIYIHTCKNTCTLACTVEGKRVSQKAFSEG